MSSSNQDIVGRESLRILQEISPQVISHYGLGDETAAHVRFRITQLAMTHGQPGKAIDLLVDQSATRNLNDTESVMLLYSLCLNKNLSQAAELYEILHTRRPNMASHLQQDLDSIAHSLLPRSSAAPLRA